MFPHHQRYAGKRPSIGTSATGGSRRQSSSSLPPSPWSPGTRYEPFFGDAAAGGSLSHERTHGGSGGAGVSGGEGGAAAEKHEDPAEDEQDLALISPFRGFVRRVSRIGMMPGTGGWKGYMRVGGREHDEEMVAHDEEEGRLDRSGGGGGSSNAMSSLTLIERPRPWWRSAAALVTAVNLLLFCVTLFVCWRHGRGGGKCM